MRERELFSGPITGHPCPVPGKAWSQIASWLRPVVRKGLHVCLKDVSFLVYSATCACAIPPNRAYYAQVTDRVHLAITCHFFKHLLGFGA